MDARTVPIVPAAARSRKDAAFEYLTTRKDELVGWARKFSLFPYPFVSFPGVIEISTVGSTPFPWA